MNPYPYPIRELTTIIRKRGAFSRKNFPKIAAFYLKLIAEEPFRLFENVSRGDEIRDHELKEEPIFIIGHWRSGTSFLQHLLGKDPQFGFINKFQVVFPNAFLQSEHFLKPLLQQVPKTLGIIKDAQNMSINLDLDTPSEIEIALTTVISPASLHWGHIFPQDAWDHFNKFLFFDRATSSEIAQWKHDFHHLIKKASIKNNERQLLIKSPGNSARINKLLELYPNARFIFIHRNPYDVFYSSKKLWNSLINNLALQPFTKAQIEHEIIQVYKKLMSRYLEQRENIPEGQLVELRFDDLVSDPVKELHFGYKKLQLNGFANAKSKFYDFLEKNGEEKSSSYDYEDEIVKLINRNWDFTFRQWNYPLLGTPVYAQLGN